MNAKAIVNLITFLSGVILVLNETLLESAAHPAALAFGAMLMGLPAFIRPEEDPKPKPIPRNTDLRIVARLPEEPVEREIRKGLEHLEAYDKLC